MLATAGVGTQFRRWNSSLGQWESIAMINSIDGPSMSRETYDTTALDTKGGYRTFIAGFRDAGTISLNMNFSRSTYDLMKVDFESDAENNYEIVLPDTDQTSLEFVGFVTELPLSVPTADKITANTTIKISGQVVINSGSGPNPVP